MQPMMADEFDRLSFPADPVGGLGWYRIRLALEERERLLEARNKLLLLDFNELCRGNNNDVLCASAYALGRAQGLFLELQRRPDCREKVTDQPGGKPGVMDEP